VTVGGHPVGTSRPDPTTLLIRRSLAARQHIAVAMTWTLRLPRAQGLALHGGHSARLLSFFPLLAWNGSGWSLDPPVPADSFWTTSPTADFDVHVTVPERLQVVASGESRRGGRWHARAVRDFALAVGRFQELRATVTAPRRVRLTVALERGSPYSARAFLDEAKRDLRFYASRFGDYPWTTYSIVAMRDFQGLGGTSYPTLTFLGDASDVLVPHETAHQWFYSLVGNDQYNDPWLSEGLATWAQSGPERSLARMIGTSIPQSVLNRIGEPMSFWTRYRFDDLHAGLYIQSAEALASLGSTAAVNCALRSFVVHDAYRTASPDDLLAVFVQSFPDARAKLVARGARF
jgi:hypothetical protein